VMERKSIFPAHYPKLLVPGPDAAPVGARGPSV
jgi:hypothetical protein